MAAYVSPGGTEYPSEKICGVEWKSVIVRKGERREERDLEMVNE
jgi:hypothetical protein